MLERVGREEALDRDLFVFEAASADDVPGALRLPSSRFVCLLAWDARGASRAQVSGLARRLLDAGAVYICAWGPECERVHDIVDEERDIDAQISEGVVMTTSHDNEALADALWFALMSAFPDDALDDDCFATVGVSIASPEWAAEIRAAFSNPKAFIAAGTGRG